MAPSRYDVYSTSEQAWEAMYQAILGATTSVYWEVYIFADDDMGQKFFELLERKAKEGVDVKVLIDGFGSFMVSNKRIQSLRHSGVDIQFFAHRRHRYRGMWSRLVSRTHRKVLIIDERIGFIGGVNIKKNMAQWLDLHVKIEGEAVRSLLRAFAKAYIISGGEKEKVKYLLRYPFRVKKEIQDIEFIFDEAGQHTSRARKKYTEGLLKARERVILFSPYYFPDRKFLYALWRARKRHIRVDLLIPFRTDIRIATYAAYGWFSLMKKMGVQVHLSKDMMHGKGVIVDDDWAMIGSSNIDHGSFYDNYEANVRLSDKKVVGLVKTIVEGWLAKSTKLEDMNWDKRGRWHKIKEWIAVRLYKLWHRRD